MYVKNVKKNATSYGNTSTTIAEIKEVIINGWLCYEYYIDGVLSMVKNPMTHHVSGRIVK